MESIAAVLFDLGNTLRHLDYAYVAAVVSRHAHAVAPADVAAAEYRGKAAVDAELRARRTGTDTTRQRPFFDAMLDALGVGAAARPAIAADLSAENVRSSLWRVMHDDTPAVLAALRVRGYTLGVVSNADGRAQAALTDCGLAPHFSAVIDSHVVGVEKPDPRIFHLALAACRARAEQAIFVGDVYEVDVQGARNAGLAALLLDPLGLYGDVDCQRIERLRQLLDLLPERARS
jgi:putative hydrolase of the HAD superfamily